MSIFDDYAAVQPFVQRPTDIDNLCSLVKLEVAHALRMARHSADRAAPSCYDHLDAVWTLSRCGLIPVDQCSVWHEEISERFQAALKIGQYAPTETEQRNRQTALKILQYAQTALEILQDAPTDTEQRRPA